MKKQCSKCRIEKPIEAFSRDRAMKDGHAYQCKDCVKEAVKSKPRQIVDHRICSGCHIDKPASEFYKNRYLSEGIARYCKDCAKSRRDREQAHAYAVSYYKRVVEIAVIPDEKLCRTCNRILPAKSFTRNKYSKTGLVSQCKECFKAKHGAKAVENGRRSRQKPGVNRNYKNHRKALKRNAPRIERVSRAKVYERDGGKCYMCNKELPFDGFDLEHVIPLKRGGSHTYDNVKVACRACNARKNVKLLEEL